MALTNDVLQCPYCMHIIYDDDFEEFDIDLYELKEICYNFECFSCYKKFNYTKETVITYTMEKII